MEPGDAQPSRPLDPPQIAAYVLAYVEVGMAMAEFSKDDRVSWSTSQGRTRGRVVERKIADFEFDGQHFTASKENPAFIVQSEKTGARAAHKATALRRLKN